MTKFPSRSDLGYERIVGELQRWAQMASREFENEQQPG